MRKNDWNGDSKRSASSIANFIIDGFSCTTLQASGDPVRQRSVLPIDNAVVFDFKPGIDAGAENLSRRGEDARFADDRPAAQRRRDIQERMAERGEGETRADVARRLDQPEIYGPESYEIGSETDPDARPQFEEDWLEDDPGE